MYLKCSTKRGLNAANNIGIKKAMDPIVNNTTKQVQTVSTVKFKCMLVCGWWRSLFKISKGGDMNNETIFSIEIRK